MTTERCREIGWQARQDELRPIKDQPMIGPWHWEIHDHSMATLCGGGEDAMIGHIMSVGPCETCAKQAEPKEWVWGRCMTPSLPEARLIAASRELLDALVRLVAVSGYTYMNDDELRHEAEFGNGFAPIILAARTVISRARGE